MKYVNILNTGSEKKVLLSESSAQYQSLSMTNDEVGICPKCKKSMSTASIQSGENVLYCESCRVALPLPNPA